MKLFRACPLCKHTFKVEDKDGNIGYNRCPSNNCPISFEQWCVRDFPLNATSHLRPLPKPHASAYSVEIVHQYKIMVHENNFKIWKVNDSAIDTNLLIKVEQPFKTDYFQDPEALLQRIKLWLTFS